MNKKILLPVLALIVYVVIIWPKGAPDNKDQKTSSPELASQPKKEGKANLPQRQGDPNFKAEIVENLQASKEKKEFFRVTAPEAKAYAENDRLAYEQGAGKTPQITEAQIAESKQLQSVIEATKNPEQYGSRLSPMLKAASFEKERFKTDEKYRDSYLSSAEPGRVYQVDSKSSYRIKRVSPYYQEVSQGESVIISVEAEPNMPVSITSFDLGKFGNHLTFQTVVADASGIANFEFFGMEGTFNDSNILASSPTSRGQVKFVVHTKIKTLKDN